MRHLRIPEGMVIDPIQVGRSNELSCEAVKRTYPLLPYSPDWSRHHELVVRRRKMLEDADADARRRAFPIL